MIVAEILVETAVPHAELEAALVAALAVPASSVAVVENIEAVSTEALVSAVVSDLVGDFRLRVEVYADDRVPRLDEQVIATSLAQRLSCSVLLSDASVNPCSWLMVTSMGQLTAVFLDVDALDSRGEVKFVASSP